MWGTTMAFKAGDIMSDSQPVNKKPVVFTDRLRAWTSGIINPIGATLFRLGVHPDMVTIFGLFLVGIAAVIIARAIYRIEWQANQQN